MRAIVLISGGLDSALGVKILESQGIEVIGLNFSSPFSKPLPEALIESLDIKIKTVAFGKDYLKILKNPHYGFGKNLNPCIDCHIYMLKKAKQLMRKVNAKFIATGEVLGQRPMSQHKKALNLIEEESGLAGLLLRPLSAKLLDPTIPEKKGWIERKKLFAISGRGRQDQFRLVKRFKLAGFSQPAGGCLLTDKGFSMRLKDLIRHENLNWGNITLLRTGRHLRLSPKAKLVVGRDEKENKALEKLASAKDYLFMTIETPGPVAIGGGNFNEKKLLDLACEIVAFYADNNGKGIKVYYSHMNSPEKSVKFILPSKDNSFLEKLRI